MKLIERIDDSHCNAKGERVIHVVELAENIFVDVMVINDGYHSPNYSYIMDFKGGQAYTKVNGEDIAVDYPFDAGEVIEFVDRENGIL